MHTIRPARCAIMPSSTDRATPIVPRRFTAMSRSQVCGREVDEAADHVDARAADQRGDRAEPRLHPGDRRRDGRVVGDVDPDAEHRHGVRLRDLRGDGERALLVEVGDRDRMTLRGHLPADRGADPAATPGHQHDRSVRHPCLPSAAPGGAAASGRAAPADPVLPRHGLPGPTRGRERHAGTPAPGRPSRRGGGAGRLADGHAMVADMRIALALDAAVRLRVG
jgi:hypothetical protein